MNSNANQRRMIINGMTVCLVLSAPSTACTPVPGEIDPFGPNDPVDCNDLVLNPLIIGEIPLNQDDPDVVRPDTMFRIRWFAEFVRGHNMNYFGFTGDYIARVTILKNGEEILSVDVDATPLNVASGAYDEIILEDGLPAGTYTIRVVLDPIGAVDQCHDLLLALNNVREETLEIDLELFESADAPPGQSGATEPSAPRPTIR